MDWKSDWTVSLIKTWYVVRSQHNLGLSIRPYRPLALAENELAKALIQIIHQAVSNLDYVKKIEGPIRDIVIESYIQGFVSTHCKEFRVRRQYLSTD